MNRAKVQRALVQVVQAVRRVEACRDRAIKHTRHVHFQEPQIGQVEITISKKKEVKN
jgi:hypothetical protein